MHLRLMLVAAIATTTVALAQNPITADSPFQVRYASNLTIGDSVVNVTNTGARGGVTNQSGTTAAVPGSICVNAYAFDPTEEIVSCCSCPVTPNELVSISAQKDLISNPLFPRTPTSIVIKLVATVPVGGSCTNAAATVATATLAPGMAAWGTTLHAGVGAGAWGVTETAFTPSTLSASELAKLQSVCAFALAQGSGFGVCPTGCRVGGLGAAGSSN